MTSGTTLKKLFVTSLSILLLALLLPSPLFAQNVNAPEGEEDPQITLGANDVVDEDYFAAGDTVTISGTVNGDVYVAAGNIYVDGTVNGDLMAAGGNVTISGTVAEDIRTAGGNITVSGEVDGSLTALGGNITVTSDATIGESLVASGGTVQVYAPVTDGITLAASQVTLGNTVGGNITAGVGELSLAPEAQIEGDLTYWSDQEANIANEASVSGEVVRNTHPQQQADIDEDEVAGFITQAVLTYKILSFIAALIVGLILIRLTPRFTTHVAAVASNQIGMSLLIGLITLILSPIIIFVLLLTIIGIPLAFIIGGVYLLALYLAKIFVGLALGRKIFDYSNRQKTAQGWALLVGLAVLYLVELIPIIGWVVWLVVLVLGVGALITTKYAFYNSFRDKKII